MARPPESAALLDAWEDTLYEPDAMRAPSLLVWLGWLTSPQALEDSTVGEIDRLLFSLHNVVFGAQLECAAVCESCGQTLEFATSTTDILPAAPPVRAARVGVLGGSLQCRLPVNADMSELLSGGGPIGSRQLLRRCVLNDDTNLQALSEEDCDRALAELAEADPGSSVEFAIQCSCAHRWIEEFDIRSYLLAELTDWAVRTLRAVHRLASRYGWSESAILAMSPWRKQIYLEACEGA